jgi:hypothetical protein
MIGHPPPFHEGEFRKAQRSEPYKDCVHVARRAGWVALRDTKMTFGASDDHLLLLTDEEFDGYQTGVRSGQFEGHALRVTGRADGTYVFTKASSTLGVELIFTRSELLAFHDGIAQREFDLLAYA